MFRLILSVGADTLTGLVGDYMPKNEIRKKKAPKTVQRSVYWPSSLVRKVERERKVSHRSWSAQVAWIVESYFKNKQEVER